LFPGPSGGHLSRDALEHRLAKHLNTAAKVCASLSNKHVTMHTLRHTAMRLLHAGVDISVIALWLGHQHTTSTDVYLHADMTIKQAAIDRTRPLQTIPGTYTTNQTSWPGSTPSDYADIKSSCAALTSADIRLIGITQTSVSAGPVDRA